MAIAYDNSATGSGFTSFSFTLVLAAGATGVAVALTMVGGDSGVISTCKVGSTSMTSQIQKVGSGGSSVEIWGVVNPPTGSQTIAITTTSTDIVLARAMSVTGGDTTTLMNGTWSNNGTGNPSTLTTTSSGNGLLFDAMFCNNTAGGGATAQSGQGNTNDLNSGNKHLGSGTQTSANASGGWSTGFGGAVWQEVAAEFKVASATGSLFRQSNLNGLQSGGPFFANPLAKVGRFALGGLMIPERMAHG